MQQFDYTFIFQDVGTLPGLIQFLDHQARRCFTIELVVDDHHLAYGASPLRSILADMVDVGIATYVADRFVIRRHDEKAKIRLVLPVRHPELVGDAALLKLLVNTLAWFTGDHWSFEFIKRTHLGKECEIQSPLFLERPTVREVALWSGGLDSLAGLYWRLDDEPTKVFTLCIRSGR